MAVVSISRIQVRRGQKNAGSGLPQLASGEFGWAVDSQELYIGNGAVSEGSPFVGNTKMLSQHDNLFEFANTYSYKKSLNIQTGASANSPILRTLQARLDDRVSIRSFGANGDGTDQTVALQRAVDQLYLNASNKGTTQARVELILEAGEYTITAPINLPPFATIRGAGPDKTIIISAGTFASFTTVNDTSTPGTYSSDATSTTLNQARNISISGLTIRNTSNGAGIQLVSCKDSRFENLIIQGGYTFGGSIDGSSDGIHMSSLSTAVSSNSNTFNNVTIKNFVTAVKSDHDIKDNLWSNCIIDYVWQGFAFGANTVLGTSGMLTGPVLNKIDNSKFNDVYTMAIQIVTGIQNISSNNKFYRVGNNGGSSLLVSHPVIKFDGLKNLSRGDWFERSTELGYDETYKNGVAYLPEVMSPTITEFDITHKIAITQSGEYTKLFRLPAETTKGYEIDYIYKSSLAGTRSGTMKLVVDPAGNTFNFADDYEYTGNEAVYAENLKFKAQNYDENGDTVVDTIAIMMLNSTSSDAATLYYKVKTKS